MKARITRCNIKGAWEKRFAVCYLSSMCLPFWIVLKGSPKPGGSIISASTFNCPSEEIKPKTGHVCTNKVHYLGREALRNPKDKSRFQSQQYTQANDSCLETARLELVHGMGLENVA